MRWLKNLVVQPWINHPHATGETYWQHLLYALWTSLKVTLAGLMLLVHAFFPFLFVTTGSKILCKVVDKIRIRNGGRE